MLDPQEWDWLEEHADGRLRPPADRHVAAVPARARAALPRVLERGGLQRRLGRAGRARWASRSARRVDLEHWAAFGSLARPDRCSMVERVGTGATGTPPASIVALSGDVHHAYLAEVGFQPRHRDALGRLPGDLLAVPQPARRARAAHRSASRAARAGTLVGEAARPRRRRRRPAGALALHARRAVLRQPGLLPRARRPRGAPAAAEDRPRGERGLLVGDGLRARARR